MTRFDFVLLCSLSAAIGCGSQARDSYGTPTDTTMISLEQTGGFVANRSLGVQIAGTAASYHQNGTTGQGTVATADVATLVQALEDIQFLSLDSDYTSCKNQATDFPTATIAVTLSAGSNMVRHYLGCKGGTFDDLAALENQIADLSGLSDWVNGR
jgi:hypothetical protein